MNEYLSLALELKALARRRSEGLGPIRELSQRFAELGRYDTPEAFALIAEWTRARFGFAKKKRAVLGVSGGVDSSLTLCVLVEALGAKNVFAFILPAESDATDARDAQRLCDALGVTVKTIDLTAPLEAMRALLSPAAAVNADGNLKTRLRTMTLFHEAAARDALYVGTGDLDEGFVGYYTKGSGADLAPIGSLHKSEVRKQLAFALGRIDKKLARQLSQKPADAGLIKGRTAEEDLGITYDELERALEVIFETCALYEAGVVPREVDEFAETLKRSGVSLNMFKRATELVYGARHKAVGAPVLWRPDTTRTSAHDFESE